MQKPELLGALGLVVLLTAMIVVFTLQYEPAVRPPYAVTEAPDETAHKTTVAALLRAYQKNHAQWDRAFKNQTWEVKGIVSRIERNWLGHPVVRLRGPADRSGAVPFILRQEEDEQVAFLQQGDTVVVRGVGEREPRHGIRFRNCVLVF